MKILTGTKWKNIDPTSEEYSRVCIVTYIDDNPDHNGDGDIVLEYNDKEPKVIHTGKVRRFMPGITHIFIP
jgi:hypothetical protein